MPSETPSYAVKRRATPFHAVDGARRIWRRPLWGGTFYCRKIMGMTYPRFSSFSSKLNFSTFFGMTSISLHIFQHDFHMIQHFSMWLPHHWAFIFRHDFDMIQHFSTRLRYHSTFFVMIAKICLKHFWTTEICQGCQKCGGQTQGGGGLEYSNTKCMYVQECDCPSA